MPGLAFAKLDDTRFTSCGGAGAPPPPTETRLDVSVVAKLGDSSRSQLCVGTPTKFVTRSRSISSRARSGSHLRIITSFRPLAKHDIITGMQPVTWKRGTTRMNAGAPDGAGASGRRRRSTAARHPKPRRACTTARWVETAPFGRPVVPDV